MSQLGPDKKPPRHTTAGKQTKTETIPHDCTHLLSYIEWSRFNTTNHDSPVGEVLYRDRTDEISGDHVSQLYAMRRKYILSSDEAATTVGEILMTIAVYMRVGRDVSSTFLQIVLRTPLEHLILTLVYTHIILRVTR